VTLVVAVQDLPRRTRANVVAQGHQLTDTLRLRFRGRAFDPPLELRAIPQDSVDRSTPLGAEEAAFSAFKRADPNWIIESFADPDRREILSFLSDTAVSAGSRHMFDSIDAVHVYAVTDYQVRDTDYKLVFFSYHDSPSEGNVHAYVSERGEWKRTNRLARDSSVTFAFRAFRAGRIQGR
jgi:hypothetical protein